MRRTLTIAAALTVGVCGASGAYAATRGHDTQTLKPPKLISVTQTVHLCHPGLKGSRLDSLG